MDYWCVTFPNGSTPSVFWAWQDSEATFRIGTAMGHGGGSLPLTAPLPHDVQSRYSTALVEKVAMAPGEHYPRIYRPWGEEMLEVPFSLRREWAGSVQAVRNLLVVMDNLFRYLEPHTNNARAFGHELRQLLILACTEVESSCKAVLKANQYRTAANARYCTRDYVKVAGPLRLREWEVSLRFHPEYPSFKPFATWNDTNPTQSLPWYDAYNAVKHDREENFQLATLEHIIAAVGAAYLLVPAQFGLFRNIFASQADTFEVKEPAWASSDYYVPPTLQPGASWTPVSYPF